jgi:GntP family gluconate:H+ symporter
MEKDYCVYCHTNNINGKRYIGITCQKPEHRWRNGKGYINNSYFYRAIQKYGWHNFSHNILYMNLSKEDAEKIEVELIAEYGKLPSGFSSLAPIIVPIILMALASIFSMAQMTGIFADIVAFLGTPIIALAVGTVFATAQLSGAGKMSEFYNICNETLKTVGPILFVTAAGGVLGKVISASDMVNYISSHAEVLSAMGIFFPFLLSAILKSAQGSSTVALTTTAGIVAPLLPVLGFTTPVQVTLVCMAIGAGAMTVSHANDSYFWVVTNFGAMSPDRGYKTQTMNTLVMGIAAIVEIALLSLILH